MKRTINRDSIRYYSNFFLLNQEKYVFFFFNASLRTKRERRDKQDLY